MWRLRGLGRAGRWWSGRYRRVVGMHRVLRVLRVLGVFLLVLAHLFSFALVSTEVPSGGGLSLST